MRLDLGKPGPDFLWSTKRTSSAPSDATRGNIDVAINLV